MLIYLFYGVPYCCYAVWCLIINHWNPLFIDLSLLFAGMAANVSTLNLIFKYNYGKINFLTKCTLKVWYVLSRLIVMRRPHKSITSLLELQLRLLKTLSCWKQFGHLIICRNHEEGYLSVSHNAVFLTSQRNQINDNIDQTDLIFLGILVF